MWRFSKMAKTPQKDIDRSTRWKREHPDRVKEYYVKDKDKNNKRSREYYHTHRDEIIAKNKANGNVHQRNFNYMKRLGITYADYLIYTFNKKNEQGGACAVCGSKDKKLELDHNHKTNQLRGLLCGSCNRALGLMKENRFFLDNMKKYIDEYSAGNVLDKIV
jgi:hypothetical protein